MLPIYIMYDSDVTQDEVDAIIEGMSEVATFFPGRKIINYGSNPWSEGDYSSAGWYIQKTRRIMRPGHPLQLDAGFLTQLLYREPWQEMMPHIDICFTSQPLTARIDGENYLNFCFGLTSGRIVVNSVHAYRSLPPQDKKLAIKAVVWHELGHVFELAADSRRGNTEMNLGRHCTNPNCVMRQGLSVPAWVRNAREASRHGIYCPQCRQDAARVNW